MYVVVMVTVEVCLEISMDVCCCHGDAVEVCLEISMDVCCCHGDAVEVCLEISTDVCYMQTYYHEHSNVD